MKNKLLKSIMLSTLISTLGVGTVFAAADVDYEAQPSNVSDYSIRLEISGGGTVSASTNLEVKGLTSNKIDSYVVSFVDKDAKVSEISMGNLYKGTSNYENTPISLAKTTDGRIMKTVSDAFLLSKKEYYAYIYNCTKKVNGIDYCKPTTTTPIKVEKDSLPQMTEKYKVYFFGNGTLESNPYVRIFPLFPSVSQEVMNLPLNLKVGIIEDSSIIQAMARNESGAIQKLYDYAKNATNGSNYSTKLYGEGIDTSNLTVQNGRYYYLYTTVEDLNHEFVDLSDVAIAMGRNGVIVNEIDYGEYGDIQYEKKDYEYACYACTNEYVWTAKGYQAKTCKLVDSITEKSKCVKNVKTGVEDYLLPGMIVLFVGAGIVTFLNKKSHFKQM